jgi:hypothetical protein
VFVLSNVDTLLEMLDAFRYFSFEELLLFYRNLGALWKRVIAANDASLMRCTDTGGEFDSLKLMKTLARES